MRDEGDKAMPEPTIDSREEEAEARTEATLEEGLDELREEAADAAGGADGLGPDGQEQDGVEAENPEDVEAEAQDDAEADEAQAPDEAYDIDEEAEAAEELPFDKEGVLVPGYDRDEFLRGETDDWVDDNQRDYYRYGDKMHNVRQDVVNTDVDAGGLGRHGVAKAGKYQPMNEHQRRSRRMRRVLTVVAVLLIALLAALGYFGLQLLRESSDAAAQQAAAPAATEVGETAEKDEAAKEAEAVEKRTEVPQLARLLNTTPDAAVDALGQGAIVTLDAEVEEANNPVKQRQTVVLTDEPVDSKSGTPTVYLGMDAAGTVIEAGYSAATTSLGYGTMSFADAVEGGHIIEQTLRDAGLDVPDGTVRLPAKETYSSYAQDGTTLVKEQCTFEGAATQDGVDYEWSAVLLYNYTAANASGNLADTVRTVFVYIDLAQPKASSEPASSSSS